MVRANSGEMHLPRVLGVIPARGGSKGIPKKNIANLAGQPLVAHTIIEARASQLSEVVVSTDDPEIAEISASYGLKPPFLRPKSLSEDDSLSVPVIMHCLDFMEEAAGAPFDAVMMLQPTSPLRSHVDINECIDKLFRTNSDSIISVANVEGIHPLRMKRIVGDLLVNYIEQGIEDMRPRQQLPPVFIRNGAIYLTTTGNLRERFSFAGPITRPYVMPSSRSVNIDSEMDLIVAEGIIQGTTVRAPSGHETKR